MVTAWLDPKLNSSDRTKQLDDDSLVTMVTGLGSISFLLLEDDSLPVWDWQRLRVIPEVRNTNSRIGARWQRGQALTESERWKTNCSDTHSLSVILCVGLFRCGG